MFLFHFERTPAEILTSIHSRPRVRETVRERVNSSPKATVIKAMRHPKPYISPAWEEDDWSISYFSFLNTCTH